MEKLKAILKNKPIYIRIFAWSLGLVFFIIFMYSWARMGGDQDPSSPPIKTTSKLSTPSNTVSPKELWVNRIEIKAEEMQKAFAQMQQENQAIKQQIELMTPIIHTIATSKLENGLQDHDKLLKASGANMPDSFDQESLKDQYTRPPQDLATYTSVAGKEGNAEVDRGFRFLSTPEDDTPKDPKEKPRTVEEIIPAGAYAPGVLTVGIAANTSLNAQSDPMPTMVRLTDKGKLPKGFRSNIKEAVLIAACYGDISSERAHCRLNKLLLVERNGEVLSRKVEGWIVGDDGIPGVKGKVIDRAGEVVRGAFWSGLLSGVASYFKASAQQPLFAMTGAGAVETKKMPNSDLLRTAGANGISSALEKIADYALKRAEQMQPVIIVNPGRIVDVVFKEDVDLSTFTVTKALVLKGQGERETHAQQEALNKNVQVQDGVEE